MDRRPESTSAECPSFRSQTPVESGLPRSSEWATLQSVFPDGVRDFSRWGVDQQGTIPWQTYQDAAAGGAVIYGGRPLGPPPTSR